MRLRICSLPGDARLDRNSPAGQFCRTFLASCLSLLAEYWTLHGRRRSSARTFTLAATALPSRPRSVVLGAGASGCPERVVGACAVRALGDTGSEAAGLRRAGHS